MMGILQKIRTKSDLEYLMADLDVLKGNLYKVEGTLEVPLLIKAEFEAAPDKEQYLENLKQDILKVGVVELTTPVYLDESALQKLTVWVKTNLGEKVVMDLKVDPKVLAGVNISWNGKFKDYSWKTALLAAITKTIA